MTNTDILKEQMIAALEKTLGIVTSACKQVGISRDTHYRWLREDSEYKKQVDDVENVALDFVESKLHNQIANDIPVSTIFYLKTKGKKRGYIERQEIVTDTDNFFKVEIVDAADTD